MSVGTRIKEARKIARLTQIKLASRIGINRATVSKYENGEIEPPLFKVREIARALNVTMFQLLQDELKGDDPNVQEP